VRLWRDVHLQIAVGRSESMRGRAMQPAQPAAIRSESERFSGIQPRGCGCRRHRAESSAHSRRRDRGRRGAANEILILWGRVRTDSQTTLPAVEYSSTCFFAKRKKIRALPHFSGIDGIDGFLFRSSGQKPIRAAAPRCADLWSDKEVRSHLVVVAGAQHPESSCRPGARGRGHENPARADR